MSGPGRAVSQQRDAAPASLGVETPADIAKSVIAAFDKLFAGPHLPGRAVHAKGLFLSGQFVPTAEAASLSTASHFQTVTPILVRLSDFAGIPSIGDGADEASPRGMSIKFQLPDGGDTDLVAHSYNGFPARTGEEFRDFLQVLGRGSASEVDGFLADHHAARTFALTPKPAPASFATEAFFGVNAFSFKNADGVERAGRYFIRPVAGEKHLSADESRSRAPDYLKSEMQDRLTRGAAEFKVRVQLANDGDDLTDATKVWGADHRMLDIGTLRLTTLLPASDELEATLFTPLNLPEGISGSDDPLLVARTRAYRLSHQRRTVDARQADAGRPE